MDIAALLTLAWALVEAGSGGRWRKERVRAGRPLPLRLDQTLLSEGRNVSITRFLEPGGSSPVASVRGSVLTPSPAYVSRLIYIHGDGMLTILGTTQADSGDYQAEYRMRGGTEHQYFEVAIIGDVFYSVCVIVATSLMALAFLTFLCIRCPPWKFYFRNI